MTRKRQWWPHLRRKDRLDLGSWKHLVGNSERGHISGTGWRMGIFPPAGSKEKRGITSQKTVNLKAKCTVVVETERFIRASASGCCHIAQLPLGVSRTPPSSPWRLCWSSLSSTVRLCSSKEQPVRFCLRFTPEIGCFRLFVGNKSQDCVFILPSLIIKWRGPLVSPVPPADAEPQEAKTAPGPGNYLWTLLLQILQISTFI